MFKSRLVVLALSLCSFASLSVVAKADTLTFDFTYTGTGTFVSGETASGMGSFTLSFTSLNSPIVSAFSFTDTLTAPGATGSSTFNYTLADLGTPQIVLGGTLADPFLATMQIQTNAVTGSNSNFGPASYGFSYASVDPGTGNTMGTTGQFLDDFTNGNTVLTLVPPPAVPEPSSYALLATGMLGMALFYLKRNKISSNLI
jgi:hypothetical protein